MACLSRKEKVLEKKQPETSTRDPHQYDHQKIGVDEGKVQLTTWKRDGKKAEGYKLGDVMHPELSKE